jgi:hypothetical protein
MAVRKGATSGNRGVMAEAKKLFSWRWVLPIVVCLVGLSASVIPSFVYTDPIWGVSAFSDKELFGTEDLPGIVVLRIDPGSPVASAGVQKGDRILKVNAKQPVMATFRRQLENILAGETLALDVRRKGQEMRLTYQGEVPTLEGVLFLDWQFVAAPIFLVLLLVLIVTQPLEPPPWWRAILVLLGGLAVLIVITVIELTQFIPWSIIWQSKAVSHGPPNGLHYLLVVLALLAGLALGILGAMEVRAVFMRKAHPEANAGNATS